MTTTAAAPSPSTGISWPSAVAIRARARVFSAPAARSTAPTSTASTVGSSSSSRATSSARTAAVPSAASVKDGPVRLREEEIRLAITLPM